MSTDFQVPTISSEQVEENKGVFTIEPLDKGFGYTFGSSLRRVLLSSLGGAAITSVRIEGVSHEFSNIAGVKEDVTDIVLNLKDLVVRMHTDADAAAKKGMEHGLQKVEVFAKGAGSGKDTAVRSLQAAGLEVTSVKDVTPQAHNGCRPRKRRRV